MERAGNLNSPPLQQTGEHLRPLRDVRLWSVALVFGAITMMWTTYNEYVPDLFQAFGAPALMLSIVLTTDSLLGFFLEPASGMISDRTRGQIKAKLPWLLLAMPVAALFFALIPIPFLQVQRAPYPEQATQTWFLPFMVFVAVMLIAMSLFRTPTVAMMPEVANPAGLNVASGLLQLLSGLGAFGALFLGGWLVPTFGIAAPFWLASAVMVAAGAVLWRFRAAPPPPDTAPPPAPTNAATDAVAEGAPRFEIANPRDFGLVMAAIMAWALGFQYFSNLFGEITAARWGLSELQPSLYQQLLFFSMGMAAIPAGMLADQLGRRRLLVVSTMATIAIVALIVGLTGPGVLLGLLMIGGGVVWAGVTVGNYPLLLEVGPRGRNGTITGLFFMANAAAGFAGPWILQALRPSLGDGSVWLALVWWLLALALLSQVSPGVGAGPAQS